MATTPKACASASTKAGTAARSRSGTSASSRTSTATVELGTRNIKVALRRLRKFARTGRRRTRSPGTIRSTAQQGFLDVQLRPERRNAVKVLLFFDVGGSMDWHIEACEELFSAARTEFKHLEYFYFHNCLYERVWRENRRRFQETTPTWDVLHTYAHDYKVIFVGDASMSPYEIVQPGGSVEHMNPEPASCGCAACSTPIRTRSGSTRCRSATGATRRRSA
jgi:uncharacterized protein with von Willebrand factor type A (vWA) domain